MAHYTETLSYSIWQHSKHSYFYISAIETRLKLKHKNVTYEMITKELDKKVRL